MTHFSRKPPDSLSKKPLPRTRRHQKLTLGGVELIPDLSGALYVPDYSTLLVADLHFEKGSSFLRRGLHIPPFDTRSTLAVLGSVLAQYRPRQLIALGDSFHDRRGPDRLDPVDRDRILRMTEETDVVWITGNHDPEIPADIGGRASAEASLGHLTLRHIPRSLDEGCEMAGHFHPVASVVARGRRLTARSFVANERRLLLPAFGAYTGGLSVRAPEIASLFAGGTFKVWMIGREDIFSFSSSAVV